jgi:hypothetical protein
MISFQEIDLAFGGPETDSSRIGFSAVLAYLRARGIGQEDIPALDLRIVPAQPLKDMTLKHTRGHGHDERLAVVFPHFDFTGQYLPWWSARLVDIGPRPATGFQALMPQNRPKMLCPPLEPPHAYLPPQNWAFQEGERVYIHESALKSLNGHKLGGKHIGLNGVWGWCSAKHDIALIRELKDIPWKQKKLVPAIVFDSNYDDNDQVALAIARLGAKIQELTGQHAIHLPLPRAEDGKHQGFDDFCVAVGPERAKEYLNSEGVPVAIGELELLKLKLNTKVCIVRSIKKVVDLDNGTIMSRAEFTDVNYADYVAREEDGKGGIRAVNVPKLWLTDPRRNVVNDLDYMPGQPQVADNKLNLWKGMGCDPAKGDVTRWLDLVHRNIKDAKLAQWFVQWLAWPLQNIGGKLNTFCHLYGPPGTGKQAVLAPLMQVYGANGITISKRELSSDFNSIYAHKQLINVDEMHSDNNASALAVTNKIKMLVTDTTMTVNMKGQPEYTVGNCANLVTTSNYVDSIRLDDDDRRCAVIRFGERGMTQDRLWWEDYFRWVQGDGAAAVYAYLLEVDMTEFDPKGMGSHD